MFLTTRSCLRLGILYLTYCVSVSSEEDASTEHQPSSTSSTSSPSQQYHIHKGPTHRRRVPVCINGKPSGHKCECEADYVGKHCEKKKNCATFRRFRNGTCPVCLTGFTGEFCEEINCEHGQKDLKGTSCICYLPWTGQFCSDLSTKQVYGYYNRRVYWLGPLGALSLLPMCGLYMGCEYMARKRQAKRVCNMLDGQNVTVKNSTVQYLLSDQQHHL